MAHSLLCFPYQQQLVANNFVYSADACRKKSGNCNLGLELQAFLFYVYLSWGLTSDTYVYVLGSSEHYGNQGWVDCLARSLKQKPRSYAVRQRIGGQGLRGPFANSRGIPYYHDFWDFENPKDLQEQVLKANK